MAGLPLHARTYVFGGFLAPELRPAATRPRPRPGNLDDMGVRYPNSVNPEALKDAVFLWMEDEGKGATSAAAHWWIPESTIRSWMSGVEPMPRVLPPEAGGDPLPASSEEPAEPRDRVEYLQYRLAQAERDLRLCRDRHSTTAISQLTRVVLQIREQLDEAVAQREAEAEAAAEVPDPEEIAERLLRSAAVLWRLAPTSCVQLVRRWVGWGLDVAALVDQDDP